MPEKELDVIVKAQAENAAAVDDFAGKVKSLGTEVEGVQGKTVGATKALDDHAKTAHKAAEEERLITTESRESAKAMGELGAKGGELFERFTALTSAAGGLQGTLTGGLLLGLGAIVEGAHKVDEAYQEQVHSTADLKQAAEAGHESYEALNEEFERFVASNQQFISNENEAKEVLANFARAGFDTAESMEALNVSLDLASMKNEDLTTAGNQVLLMMEGNSRVAKQLGIDITALKNSDDNQTKALAELTKANDAVAKAQDAVAKADRSLKEEEDSLSGKRKESQHDLDVLADKQATDKKAKDDLATALQNQKKAQDDANTAMSQSSVILDQVSVKTEGGRKAVDDQTQSLHELNGQWETFAKTTGPAVEYVWEVILGTAEGFIEALNDIITLSGRAADALSHLGVGGGQAQVVAGRTAQMAGSGGTGEPGVPVPAGGGGGGSVNSDVAAFGGQTNIFHIQATEPEATASAVLARLLLTT